MTYTVQIRNAEVHHVLGLETAQYKSGDLMTCGYKEPRKYEKETKHFYCTCNAVFEEKKTQYM